MWQTDASSACTALQWVLKKSEDAHRLQTQPSNRSDSQRVADIAVPFRVEPFPLDIYGNAFLVYAKWKNHEDFQRLFGFAIFGPFLWILFSLLWVYAIGFHWPASPASKRVAMIAAAICTIAIAARMCWVLRARLRRAAMMEIVAVGAETGIYAVVERDEVVRQCTASREECNWDIFPVSAERKQFWQRPWTGYGIAIRTSKIDRFVVGMFADRNEAIGYGQRTGLRMIEQIGDIESVTKATVARKEVIHKELQESNTIIGKILSRRMRALLSSLLEQEVRRVE